MHVEVLCPARHPDPYKESSAHWETPRGFPVSSYEGVTNYSVSLEAARSQLVEEDGHLTNVEEDVVLASVRYIAGEVFADDAVPVRRILRVE